THSFTTYRYLGSSFLFSISLTLKLSSFFRRLAELVSCDVQFRNCRAMAFARLYTAMGRTKCYHSRACMYGLGNGTSYSRYHRGSTSCPCKANERRLVCSPFWGYLCPRPCFSSFSPYITVQSLE